jgi:hypothetical protein
MDFKLSLILHGSGCQIRGFRESLDKFRPAVGIATVIGDIDSYKNIEGIYDFGPGKSETEKNCVSSGDIGYGYPVWVFQVRAVFWHIKSGVGKGRRLFAAWISFICLWPYLNVRAKQSKPSFIAMAKVVAESSPPLSKTMAFLFFCVISWPCQSCQ